MIASYQRKSNIAAGIFLASIAATIVLTSDNHQHLSVSTPGLATEFTASVSYLYALWALIRAKGRNGAWLLMAFLSVPGWIVLLLLKDHRKDGTSHPLQPIA